MAINKPTIAAGPSTERVKVIDQRVQTHPAGPGETYLSRVDGLLTLVAVDPPDRAGQVFFHVKTDGLNRIAIMYIGADVGGTLTWVRLSPESTINRYTGNPIDPIYD